MTSSRRWPAGTTPIGPACPPTARSITGAHRAELLGIIPTNDGRVCVPVGLTHGEFAEFRADVETNYLKTLDLFARRFAERVRCGKRVERFYGTADLPNYFRVPIGLGWALVGDAGYHKDPIHRFRG